MASNLLNIGYYTKEVHYRARSAARWTGGFATRQAMNILSGGGSVNLAIITHDAVAKSVSPWTAIAAQPFAYAFGIISLGLGVGVRAYLNHQEMQHHRERLTEDFRREIGARIGKTPGQVTEADLDTVASQIPTLDEELKRERKKMHLGTVTWAIGAVVSLAAVIGVITLLPAMPWIGSLFVGITVGYFSHQITEEIAESIGSKMMGIEGVSPLDRIRSMEQNQELGRQITDEQVMAVYVAADPQLDQQIRQNPDFGKPFDSLPLAAKHRAVIAYGKDLGIQDVTDAINENRMSARELAFRVHGQTSNAYAEPTVYQKVQDKLSRVKKTLDASRLVASQKWDGLVSRFSAPEQAAPEKEWVKDLGLQPPAPMQDQLGGWAAKRQAELDAMANAPRTIN